MIRKISFQQSFICSSLFHFFDIFITFIFNIDEFSLSHLYIFFSFWPFKRTFLKKVYIRLTFWKQHLLTRFWTVYQFILTSQTVDKVSKVTILVIMLTTSMIFFIRFSLHALPRLSFPQSYLSIGEISGFINDGARRISAVFLYFAWIFHCIFLKTIVNRTI